MRSTTETSESAEPADYQVVGLEIGSEGRALVGPIDLSLRRGEGLVLVGQMGTGKTLLLESLAGFRRPRVRHTGQFGFRDRAGQPTAGKTTLCPQDWRLAALRTDQVHTLLRDRNPHVGDLLERLEVDLERLRKLDVRALAAGERLRLLLACAVAEQPDLLLVDGAADALDPRLRGLVAAVMEAAISKGTRVIVSARDAGAWASTSFGHLQLGPALGSEVVAVPLVQKRPLDTRTIASAPVLAVSELDVERQPSGLWGRGKVALVIDDASLFVRKGEVLVLLGPSGSGKSTLLSAMAGRLPAHSGRVRVSGIDVTSGMGRSVVSARRRVQLVSSDVARELDPSLTVGEHLRRAHGQTADGPTTQWLDRLGLAPHLAELGPDMLSEGEGFRLALGLALAREPSVVLLDAPRSGALDTDGGMLTGLVLAEKARGTSFVLATSDPGISRPFADRVAILDAGRILEFGPTALLLQKPAHPRTLGLLRSEVAPAHDPRSPRRSCHMAGACPREVDRCSEERPQLDFVPGTTRNHRAACFSPNLDTIDEA